MKNCEEILIQKWALLDGERADLSAAEINAHLDACENCRQEFEQMQSTFLRLESQERQAQPADLWSAIEKRIAPESSAAASWQPFVLLVVLLSGYKLVEMLSTRDLGWTLKLVPFVIIAVLFGFLKENPFKINTELILEK